jgi:uncharacterized lipoprotein YddW (UPF0748 family)
MVLIAVMLGGMAPFLSLGATYGPSKVQPPVPLREFRAAWIASVANIDWPSSPRLSTAEQRAELVAMMDKAAQLKLNAIIFQVRPACDALYDSKIEPWSEFLTGTMGKAPEPYYDPLAFAIEEAHKRGLELHAWFNPYRARHNSSKSPIAANHISRTHPELVKHYGKQYWLDPGEKEVQDYSLSVVMDVVKRYDVDGVHFDDYFYPYKERGESGEEIEFPDQPSWQRFGARGKLSRDDWRRENVNAFIQRTYLAIKAAKPWVKFGISPFGIWRPGNPAQIRGYDAFANLYADSRKWLEEGWLDYFAPQLYWAIEAPEQSFPALLKWWAQQNKKGRHLFAGLDSTKVGPGWREGGSSTSRSSRWKPEEIVNQIRLARKQSGADGHIHWDMRSLMRGSGLEEALLRELYGQPALTPASPWLGTARPGKPELSVNGGEIRWRATTVDKPWLWLVQVRRGKEWSSEVLAGNELSRRCEGSLPEVVAVTAIDRNGNASLVAAVEKR